MHVAYETDWNSANALPQIRRPFAPAVPSGARGYADETIVAELPTLKRYALRLTNARISPRIWCRTAWRAP